MADLRDEKQINWEQGYIDKVGYIEKIRASREQAYAAYEALLAQQANTPDTNGTTSSSFSYTGGGGGDMETYRTMDIRGKTTLTAQEFNDYIAAKASSDSLFQGRGQDFIDAQNESGLNAEYIFSHSAEETGWGTSNILRSKYNFFGIGAFDSSAYESAYSYDGFKAGLVAGAVWIAEHYANKGQSTLDSMRNNGGEHQYATNPLWDENIATIWANLPHAALAVSGGSSSATLGSIGIASISNGRVVLPNVDRKANQAQLYKVVKGMSSNQFANLDSKYFSFPNGQHSNMFLPHFAQIMYLVHQAVTPQLGVDKLVISSGLRTSVIKEASSMGVKSVDPHMSGIALDVFVNGGGKNRFIIADAAWSVGIRAIGVGADHVHIDAGPGSTWREHDESKIYKGPGRFE